VLLFATKSGIWPYVYGGWWLDETTWTLHSLSIEWACFLSYSFLSYSFPICALRTGLSLGSTTTWWQSRWSILPSRALPSPWSICTPEVSVWFRFTFRFF
jgi:hypothetical protein